MTETEPYEEAEPEGLPQSCYVLEISVGSGGARLGDLHVGTSLEMLRASFAGRYGTGDAVDDYLVIWYGAVLHLWVVQEGEIVQGIDLHPFLRTGDARCDRALSRIIELKAENRDRWDVLDSVMEPYEIEKARALPLLAHVLDLQDRVETGDDAAETDLDRILKDAEGGKAPASFDGAAVERLTLDWDAVADAVPPLREPVLAGEWVSLRWADKSLRHPESHLVPWGDEDVEPLHIGVNDVENGDDEYL